MSDLDKECPVGINHLNCLRGHERNKWTHALNFNRPSTMKPTQTLLLSLSLLVLSGCTTPPRANVSNFNVYTTVHLRAVEELAFGTNIDVGINLTRYFGSTPAAYKTNHLRMDDFLDNQQRSSGYYQQRMLALTASIVATMNSLPSVPTNSSESNTNKTKSTNTNSPAAKASSGAPGTATASVSGNNGTQSSSIVITVNGLANSETNAAAKPGKTDTNRPTTGKGTSVGKTPGTQADGTGNDAAGNKPTGTQDGNTPAPPATKKPTQPAKKKPPGNSNTNAPASAKIQIPDVIEKMLETPVADSPFDQLDRVSDYYAAYLIKFLRRYGDSRTEDIQALAKSIENYEAESKRDGVAGKGNITYKEQKHRLLALYFQTHVQAGTRANTMTGLRIKILTPGVEVLRLHPTRTYDLDSVAYADSFQESADFSGKGTVPMKPANLDIATSRKASADAEERQRFLSRVGKVASFADAAQGEFGWDFYPSNPYVVHVNALEAIGRFLFGAPKLYKTKSYLEGGARDCLTYLMVPRDLANIKFEVSSFHARINPDGFSGGEEQNDDKGQIELTLPEFDKVESQYATMSYSLQPIQPLVEDQQAKEKKPAEEKPRVHPVLPGK